jgi:hypothetical protein
MKTTTYLLIVAITAMGLFVPPAASAARHHKAHHKTMAQTCAVKPGSLRALMCPQAPASSSKHKKA